MMRNEMTTVTKYTMVIINGPYTSYRSTSTIIISFFFYSVAIGQNKTVYYVNWLRRALPMNGFPGITISKSLVLKYVRFIVYIQQILTKYIHLLPFWLSIVVSLNRYIYLL